MLKVRVSTEMQPLSVWATTTQEVLEAGAAATLAQVSQEIKSAGVHTQLEKNSGR